MKEKFKFSKVHEQIFGKELSEGINQLLNDCDLFVADIALPFSRKNILAAIVLIHVYKLRNLVNEIIKTLKHYQTISFIFLCRSLIENIASCDHVLRKLETVHPPDANGVNIHEWAKAVLGSYQHLMGTRDDYYLNPNNQEGYDDGGEQPIIILPKSINILTMIEQFFDDPELKTLYVKLSDCCHPSVGFHDLFCAPDRSDEGETKNDLLLRRDIDHERVVAKILIQMTWHKIITLCRKQITRCRTMAEQFELPILVKKIK